MDFLLYLILSGIYMFLVHFAFSIKKHFEIILMVFFFAAGAVIGWTMGSFELGFIIAVFLSILF